MTINNIKVTEIPENLEDDTPKKYINHVGNIWAFDIEVYPNFFSIMLFNLNSESTPKQVSKGLGLSHPDVLHFSYAKEFGIDELKNFKSFISKNKLTLVGFNSIYYDIPVLDYVLSKKPSNKEIFEYSVATISRLNGEGGFHKKELSLEWNQIDLMKAYAFDALGVSLKQIAINLQWHRIQDLPFEFDKSIKKSDVSILLDYNLNDTLITAELYNHSYEMLNLRNQLSSLYDVDLRSASDSRMANLLLNKIYSEKTKLEYYDFSKLRTDRKLVWLRNCIGKNISFKTEKLQALLRKIMNTVVVKENNFAFKEQVEFGNCVYEIGVGGLHSVDSGGKFFSDENYVIQDADVASFYPNIILINNIIPAHLNNNFVDILRDITKERIEAKKKGDKVKAEGLKITVNSIFGKLNSETFWLQDAMSMLSVTLSGQLYLLMLIEDLMLNGIMTISSNTDGIVARIPRNLLDKYYEVCKAWESKTKFELEYNEYSEYYRIDVNNYITKKKDGSTKEKGRLLQEVSLKKGYRYPVVSRAIYNYFVHGVPVSKTLKECNNILDFCISQKAGGVFQMELESDSFTQKLQKNNRFFVSNSSGGTLLKRNKKTNQTIGLMVGELVTILNDYDETLPISEYDIKYSFYGKEAQQYITEIENGTFDFTFKTEKLGNDIFDTSSLVKIDESAKIAPAKFRYSTGTYRYDEKDNCIYRGLSTINYITEDIANTLYQYKDVEFSSFFEFLIQNKKEIGLNSRQMEILIKINYFSEFGKNKKLLQFYTEFNKIYKLNQTEKTIAKKTEHLLSLWNAIPDKSFSIEKQIALELEIFGFVQTRFNVKPNTAYVLNIDTTFSPKLTMVILKDAKTQEAKIQKKIYNRTFKIQDAKKKPLEIGDFFIFDGLEKKQAVRKGNPGEEEWVEIPNIYNDWITGFEIL